MASTHSLSDLLLDDTKSLGQEGDDGQGTPLTHRKVDILKVRLLGLVLVALGLLSFAACIFVAYSCFPSHMKHINDPIQCSDTLLTAFHRVAVEFGVHGVVIPALAGLGRFWKMTSGTPLPLADRAILIIEQEYPLGRDAFYMAMERRGERPSEVVLYCIGIVPILCGPVTLAMISLNWFSLKIFKHN